MSVMARVLRPESDCGGVERGRAGGSVGASAWRAGFGPATRSVRSVDNGMGGIADGPWVWARAVAPRQAANRMVQLAFLICSELALQCTGFRETAWHGKELRKGLAGGMR